VEVAGGRPFGEQLEALLLRPAGLCNTVSGAWPLGASVCEKRGGFAGASEREMRDA
jgi:hypothetical protein